MDDATIKLIVDMGNSSLNVKQVREEVDKLDVSVDKVGKTGKDVGRGVLELSQAFQDFAQGGLGGVLNNIDGVITKFGGAAGLAAGISVAAVAAKVLYDNWGTLMEALGRTDLVAQAEAMKKLAEEAEKVAEANMKIASSVKGQAETDRGAAFRKALAEFGGGNKLIDDVAGNDADHRKMAADAIVKALQGSENDIGYLKGGSQGLAAALRRPEQEKAIKEDEAENERRVKAREKRREDEAKADEKKAARDEKLINDLNAQGKAQEKEFTKDADKDFAEKQALNRARSIRQGRGPTFEQQASGLQSRYNDFERDAMAERARGVENGPATQGMRATMAQYEQLMSRQANAMGAMSGSQTRMAGKIAEIDQLYNAIQRNADNLPTIMEFGQ